MVRFGFVADSGISAPDQVPVSELSLRTVDFALKEVVNSTSYRRFLSSLLRNSPENGLERESVGDGDAQQTKGFLVNRAVDVWFFMVLILFDSEKTTENNLKRLMRKVKETVSDYIYFASLGVRVAVMGLGLLALSLTINSASSGRTFYVDSTAGNDSNAGTNPSTPWQNARE